MIVYWPSAVLPATSVAFWLDAQSVSGGRAVSGVERIVQRDPYWRGKLTIPVNGSRRIIAARGVFARLDGRASPLVIGVCDCGRGPGADDAYRFVNPVSPHSDTTGFADGTYYAETRFRAAAAAVAAARAVTLAVTVTTGDARRIVPGHYLSINNRLHIVRAVAAAGAGAATLTIRPPLREAVRAGQRVEFDRPRGMFRLASEDQTGLQLDMLRFSSLALEVEEWL